MTSLSEKLASVTYATYEEAANIHSFIDSEEIDNSLTSSTNTTSSSSSNQPNTNQFDTTPPIYMKKVYNPLKFNSLKIVLVSALKLLFVLFSPYIFFVLILYYLFSYYYLNNLFNNTLTNNNKFYLDLFLLIPFYYSLYEVIILLKIIPSYSPVTSILSYGEFFSTTLPGFYYRDYHLNGSSSEKLNKKYKNNIANILNRSKLFQSKENQKILISGGLPGLKSTWWIFSGHLRTILPFLFATIEASLPKKITSKPLSDKDYKLLSTEEASRNSALSPSSIQYVRRWVRVKIGSKNKPDKDPSELYENDFVKCDSDSTNSLIEDRIPTKKLYEAVAIDWACPPSQSSSSSNAPVKAILILAGLTGGSGEGYVVSLVHAAVMSGWHCFVMIGRGLHDCPLHSDAMFHGARVSDVKQVAFCLRKSLPKNSKICLVGFSLGGIIAANSSVKHDIYKSVDAAVILGGAFNTSHNTNFKRSRDLWQPILTHSLKECILSPEKFNNVIKDKIIKESLLLNKNIPVKIDTEKIFDDIKDIFDFDSIVVRIAGGFKTVNHYYSKMSACRKTIISSLSKGLKILTEDLTNEEKQLQKQLNYGLTKKVNGVKLNHQIEAETSLAVACPLLVIHSVDDPVIHSDTLNVFKNTPQIPLVLHNMAVLLTSAGGHIGWPVGTAPWKYGFAFMNEVTLSFFEAIEKEEC